jgi:hypothetical protein
MKDNLPSVYSTPDPALHIRVMRPSQVPLEVTHTFHNVEKSAKSVWLYSMKAGKGLLFTVLYHLYTLFLFTKSDIKATLIPIVSQTPIPLLTTQPCNSPSQVH